MGADENLKFKNDYIIIFNNISDSEECGRSLVADRVKEENLEEAYLLLKGLYIATGNEEYYKKLLLIGESIREKDSAFEEILLKDIDEGKKEFLDMPEPYLYKAIILRKKEDFLDLFQYPQIDAGLAASIFHRKEVNIKELKQYLAENGVEMRLI